MKPLEGRVAVVAGATRGAGRGIARMLGEGGATVYCTGRSSRTRPATGGNHVGRPETIEETAELVDGDGGRGIAVRVDHAIEAEVESLFDRVIVEQGGLDVLVNVLGGPALRSWEPFWKSSCAEGRALMEGWIWPHILTARKALPFMVERGSGLVVTVTEQPVLDFQYTVFFDLVKTVMVRLMYDIAYEAAPHGVTALAVAPGFMRTEAILDHYGATEENWRVIAETNPAAKKMLFSASETPCFLGRGVASLAADPDVALRTGGMFGSWELADDYGFTDVNGERPHWGRSLAGYGAAMGPPNISRRWELGTYEAPAV